MELALEFGIPNYHEMLRQMPSSLITKYMALNRLREMEWKNPEKAKSILADLKKRQGVKP